MKKYIAIILLLFSSSAYSEVLRCKNENTLIGSNKYPIQLDIVLPESYKLYAELSTFSGESKGIFISHLGEGIIEVSTPNTKRFKFLVTQRPSESGNSLIGFYYQDSHIHTVRVDTWKQNKPFFYYESFLNQFITGNCE